MANEGVEWVLISLDEKMARRQGLPPQIPVPKGELEGLADKGMNVETSRAWIKDFLSTSEPGKSYEWRKKNAQLVTALDTFLDKAPLWDRAQKAFSESDFEKAVSALKRIAAMDSEDHASRQNLASAYANMGDYTSSLKLFKEIRGSFEGDPDYHVALGHVHMALRDKDAAIGQMVLALEAKPDCQPALDGLLQLGVLVSIDENPRDAASLTYVRADSVASYLATLWDSSPRDAAYYLDQLVYHQRENRFDVVLAAAERALALAGTDGATAIEVAELARIAALRSLGRLDASIAAGEAYAAKAPGSSGVNLELAKSLVAAGRIEDGRAALERALELDPSNLAALMYGSSARRRERHQEDPRGYAVPSGLRGSPSRRCRRVANARAGVPCYRPNRRRPRSFPSSSALLPTTTSCARNTGASSASSSATLKSSPTPPRSLTWVSVTGNFAGTRRKRTPVSGSVWRRAPRFPPSISTKPCMSMYANGPSAP